jgi:hypothetical protein
MGFMSPAPETQSIEAFGEFLLAEERTTFTFDEACALAKALGYSLPTPVIRGLKGYGFTMEERREERRVRTISTSSHDRWYGPGSCKTHGGSGWEQIAGFAGRAG